MKIRFRRKGEVACWDFSGDVVVAGEKVEAAKLPLRDDVLDLSHLPVVTIGGRKGRRQDALLAEFEAKAPDFKGVIFMLPYSWANGWSDGHLYIPSWDALLDKGKRISGGRPEVQLTNYRWLSDGRYVADRARMLHGKAIEIIEAEVEQDVPLDELVKKLSDWHSTDFCHPLQAQCLAVWRELMELEQRRTVFAGEQSRRDVAQLIRDRLTEKFWNAAIQKVADISANFSISAAEVASDLTAQAETLGMVEIPGVGRKLAESQRPDFGYNEVPVVTLTIEEFRQVTSWPLSVYPVVAEIGDARHQLSYEMRDALATPEAERLLRLREVLSRRWRDVQRGSNFPKDILLPNPKEEDLQPAPAPVEWGFDLITGEKFTAYPYLFRQYREGGWMYRWAESTEGAERFGCSYRQEAESFMTARKLEAELTAEAQAIELPVAMPEPFAPPADPEISEVMKRLGFNPDQFQLEGEGPKRYIIPGDSYFSELKNRSVKISPDRNVTEWFRRDGDVIVMYPNITVRDLLGDDRYDYGVAEQMGVAKETIQAVRDGLIAERRQAEANYCEKVRKFVEALRAQPTYACLSSDTRAKLEELTNSFYVPDLSKIGDELRIEWAKAEVIRRRSEQGEILANFGGYFRVMGRTGNAQYWVIQPNGTERDPDEVEHRKRYSSEGSKSWRLVGPEELALSWSKSNTKSDHEFVVEKLPTGGCTAEQLATVERLEREIGERFEGAVGKSGDPSPGIGKGWGFRSNRNSKPEPEPTPTPKNTEPINLRQIDPSKLFGGSAKIRR